MFKLILLVLVLGSFPVAADPLFESDETLHLTIEGPFKQIRRDRDKSEGYAAKLTHDNSTYNVTLSVRGNKRLDKKTCSNPPLWIDFEGDEIGATLFDKQKHIKLVVQCKKGDKYRDYLRGEFLVYRMLNQLTDTSYRVRWAEVTYLEDGKGVTDPAFFIERKPRLAKRIGYKKNDRPGIRISELSTAEAALGDMFQFVIANADYSFLRGPDEDDCCHNSKLFIDANGFYAPVPYDFDSSGIINAVYAVPNEALGIRRVTQRKFRGLCRHQAAHRVARDTLLAGAPEMRTLLTGDRELGERKAKSMAKFLDASIEILRDDRSFEKEILDGCRG